MNKGIQEEGKKREKEKLKKKERRENTNRVKHSPELLLESD